MKTIISFLVYSAICLWAIIHLEPIYAIILVTVTTVLYAYYMIRDVHPNNKYIRCYKKLRQDLLFHENKEWAGFLCLIARDRKYPDWFLEDLFKRLGNIDTHYPSCRNRKIYPHSSKWVMEYGKEMWDIVDYKSRQTFIQLVLNELRQEKDQDNRHL